MLRKCTQCKVVVDYENGFQHFVVVSSGGMGTGQPILEKPTSTINDCLGSAPECATLEHDECTQLSVVQVLVKVHVDVEWEPTVVYRKLGAGLLTQHASRHNCLFSL